MLKYIENENDKGVLVKKEMAIAITVYIKSKIYKNSIDCILSSVPIRLCFAMIESWEPLLLGDPR